MSTRPLGYVKVNVSVSGYTGVLYTGKLVKTIIIRAIPEIAKHFEPAQSNTPKFVHVSPLFEEREGRVRCVYSGYECRGETVSCENPVPKRIVLEGNYSFYFGFSTSVVSLERVVEALSSLGGRVEYGGRSIALSVNSIEVVDPLAKSRRLLADVEEKGGLKIVFASPTQLRDPLRRSRFKSMVPTPFNVFSTPTFLYLVSKGLFKVRKFLGLLTVIHRSFNETIAYSKTARIVWVKYGKKPEPALAGYVKYALNKQYYEYYRSKIGFTEVLEEILAYLITLGTGTGRAAGFGHVIVEPVEVKSPDRQASSEESVSSEG
ncbi:hypothetical protein ACSU1N_06740 [Thermogladius sp. 4427co]|uniref:hypothetical protein n=1 Tax=Thermogladius sp. 4427co TaxID=3450718 RepID=UPI003F7A5CE3